MKKYYPFLHTFFFATGILWFLCGTSILIFQVSFNEAEIILTLVVPLAYAVIEEIKKGRKQEPDDKQKREETPEL